MKHNNSFLFILAALLCIFTGSCNKKAEIPDSYVAISEKVMIYPDYKEVVIPPNIAPLNFIVKSSGEEFVAAIEGKKDRIYAASGCNGKIQFDSLEWRNLLLYSKGDKLKVTIYALRDGSWVSFPTYSIYVAQEGIDKYLSYRLIEPGYMLYRQLGLYQRDLTNFCQTTIYENNRTFDANNNHCVNCHNYRNYSTKDMMFHVRASHGGTVISQNGKIEKLDFKNDSILSSAVYPSWHPKENFIAFSSNKTGQAFHLVDKQKIEVLDEASDLIFYDVSNHTVRNILKTPCDLETFPCWSPSGDRLFYTCASVPELKNLPDSMHVYFFKTHYDSLFYNVMSIPFDVRTRTFGTPVTEVDCKALGKSASVPRISPDGRYLLYTQGDYGQFHIWHKSADLYVKDLETGIVRPLTAVNSPDVDSYHTWSSNGRWIVFSSRRDDGSYTRPYIAYFDKSGTAHKAFLLPQEDPEYNILLMKSYNVPELTKDKVAVSPSAFRKAIYDDKATKKVSYSSK